MKKEFNLNVGTGAIVAVEMILQKSCGLVVIGIVINGSVSKEDPVNIKAEGLAPIIDKIHRIEFYNEEVDSAYENQKVGILLKAVSKDQLLSYLETRSTKKQASSKKHHLPQ